MARHDDARSVLRGKSRDRIVEAAIELFYERGYEATTVQEVVDHAGLTKGAFYHHFATKDDLLLLIHDRFIGLQLAEIRAIASSGMPAEDAVAAVVRTIIKGAEQFQREQTIFFEQRRHLVGARFQEVREKRDEFERLVVQIIEAGVDDGTFSRVKSVRVLSFGIIGMSAWAYQWYRPGSMSAAEISDLYTSVLLRGMTAGERGSDR